MSLNWDVTEIKNWETVTTHRDENGNPILNDEGKEQWNPVTFTLGFAAMACDLGKITEANIGEWEWRLAYLWANRKMGFLIESQEGKEPKERTFTEEELAQHIGYRVNVVTLNRTKWLARQARIAKDNAANAAWQLYGADRAEQRRKERA